MEAKQASKQNWVDRFLNTIETVCNKLPPPAILFVVLFLIAAVIGTVMTATNFSLVNPATGKAVVSQNLFSKDGVTWLLNNLVKNFTGFAPMGLVITMTLAIGFCEESGLLVTMLRRSLKNVPPSIVPYLIAFLGTVGNIASDTAMIVIPPLAAIVYIGVKKHPVVGMIVGYAGAQAGFTANLMVAGTDSLLQGLTNQAIDAFLGTPGAFAVDVTCNWYFMFVSTFLCSLVIGAVSVKIIEPRFGKYEGAETEAEAVEVTPTEVKALHHSALAVIIYVVILAVGFFTGILSKDGHTLVGSLLLKGLIPILFFLFSIAGIVFGMSTGKFNSIKSINGAMVKQMSGMGAYVVFCFFCGQFQGLFNWTQLGTLMAISGADFLKGVGFTGIPMCIAFILITAGVNIFVSSGSAKWAIFAPIFVPMFMLLGYHPGFAQLLYRLGDSPGNCFTPMSPYIWMILSVAQEKYMPNLAIGTLISNMIPIAIVLQIAWILFLIGWLALGLPIGPGVGTMLPPGIL
ncbi:AbgT family transporter [Acidaminococcus sp. NSJ-142]|jgi:aminobenzoyl-glutamate transport protein|uniref:AbgT family transporter n=1 Tax=Acidaminococcus TaxID=904 RepID=UPI000CF932CA|nr:MULTISPECIES: AbgT family transporter [Acidaminococcus]MCD2435658.1 AbgT family transporter [Acidaminococcus hominis]MCH4097089.1 AbgT family transporter [Acidaminococcus provencensis]RHK01662.1 AbgT family transporter [Acidaminococcus sp. AM05-11]